MMKKQERVTYLDVAKAISISMVILGHCIIRMGNSSYLAWLNVVIYSFHMPVFFFVSGFYFKSEEPLKIFLIKKIRTLLVPYVFFCGISFVCNLILAFSQGTAIEYLSSFCETRKIIMTIFFSRESAFAEFWFLPVLFSTEIIGYCLIRWIKKRWITISVAVAMMLFSYYVMKDLSLPFGISEAFLCIPFLLGGFVAKNMPVLKKWNYLLLVFLFIMGNIVEIKRNFGTMNLWDSDIHSIPLFLINGFCGTILCIELSKKLAGFSILQFIGKRTLWIFGLHYNFLEIICLINASFADSNENIGLNFVKIFIYAILILLCCIFLICGFEGVRHFCKRKRTI